MNKRLYGVILACLALLTLSVGAKAEVYAPEQNDTETAGSIENVMNVVVPMTLDFTIDPLELTGLGQIYSDVKVIENRGETDVLLTITDISVIFANDTDFGELAEPFDIKSASKRKDIYLLLEFKDDFAPPLILTDSGRDAITAIPLGASGSGYSSLSFTLSGSVNPYPAVGWQDGDVKISLIYQIEAMPWDVHDSQLPAVSEYEPEPEESEESGEPEASERLEGIEEKPEKPEKSEESEKSKEPEEPEQSEELNSSSPGSNNSSGEILPDTE